VPAAAVLGYSEQIVGHHCNCDPAVLPPAKATSLALEGALMNAAAQ